MLFRDKLCEFRFGVSSASDLFAAKENVIYKQKSTQLEQAITASGVITK